MKPMFALLRFALDPRLAPALAQGYPSKPITFVIPFAAGGDSDLSGRNVAQHAQKYLNNQPIVPVNRVGASGSIGRCGGARGARRRLHAAGRAHRHARHHAGARFQGCRTSGTISRCCR